MLKISHLSNSDIIGGAGIAAYRIHKALLRNEINSRLFVNNYYSGDSTVIPPLNKISKISALLKPQIVNPLKRLLFTRNKALHSLSILPSNWPKKLNNSDADIVQLHWVQNEMISIRDVGNIKKPVVMNTHDMWPFCGAEHLSFNTRWEEGYSKNNRPSDESGYDLNKYIWNLKKKYWKKPFYIVSPSTWIAQCVKKSALMNSWPCKVIPNCIDTLEWKPLNKSFSRKLLNLPDNKPILAFGTFNSNNQYHKGFDLLKKSLFHLKTKNADFNLVIFGQKKPLNSINYGFPTYYLGRLQDGYSLKALYNASDILLVPSRVESFCNIACEAHSCGVPVVSFGVGGLKDIVQNKETGYLADPFDFRDFSEGILWVLSQINLDNKLNYLARKKAVDTWDYKVISKKYEALYDEILNKI